MYHQFNAQTLHFLYTLYVFRVLTVRLLPGHWILWNPSDETLSSWVTATVSQKCLSLPEAKALPCLWVTRVTELDGVHTSYNSAQNEYKECV